MKKKKLSNQYLKVVEWSAEDNCYVGTAPGLFIGGVHGKSQKKVFDELCEAVDEAIELLQKEGRPLPPPTADKKYSGKIALRVSPRLHQSLAIRALQEGESLNKLIQHKLEAAI
jgi:predicted HicB family RNase H-like nuclease